MNTDNIIDLSQPESKSVEPKEDIKSRYGLWKIVILIACIVIIAYLVIQEVRYQECLEYWKANPYFNEGLARQVCGK